MQHTDRFPYFIPHLIGRPSGREQIYNIWRCNENGEEWQPTSQFHCTANNLHVIAKRLGSDICVLTGLMVKGLWGITIFMGVLTEIKQQYHLFMS